MEERREKGKLWLWTWLLLIVRLSKGKEFLRTRWCLSYLQPYNYKLIAVGGSSDFVLF